MADGAGSRDRLSETPLANTLLAKDNATTDSDTTFLFYSELACAIVLCFSFFNAPGAGYFLRRGRRGTGI